MLHQKSCFYYQSSSETCEKEDVRKVLPEAWQWLKNLFRGKSFRALTVLYQKGFCNKNQETLLNEKRSLFSHLRIHTAAKAMMMRGQISQWIA